MGRRKLTDEVKEAFTGPEAESEVAPVLDSEPFVNNINEQVIPVGALLADTVEEYNLSEDHTEAEVPAFTIHELRILGDAVWIEDLLQLAREKLTGKHESLPCYENDNALTAIDQALFWLNLRRRRRERQGVWGTDLPHKEQ